MSTVIYLLVIGTAVLAIGYLLAVWALRSILGIRRTLGVVAGAAMGEKVDGISPKELHRRINILYDEIEKIKRKTTAQPKVICTLQKYSSPKLVEKVTIEKGEIVPEFAKRVLSGEANQRLDNYVKRLYEHLLFLRKSDLVTLVELSEIPEYVIPLINQSDLDSLSEHSTECFKSLLSAASKPIEEFSTEGLKDTLRKKLNNCEIQRAALVIDESVLISVNKSLDFVPVDEPESSKNYPIWKRAMTWLFPSDKQQALIATAQLRQKYNWYLREYSEVLEAYPTKKEQVLKKTRTEMDSIQALLNDLFNEYTERFHSLDTPHLSLGDQSSTTQDTIEYRIKEFYRRVVFTNLGYSKTERVISLRDTLHNYDDQITIVEYDVPTIKQVLGFYKNRKNKDLTQKQRRAISQSMHAAVALSLAKQLQTNQFLAQSKHLVLNLYSSVIEPETGRSSSQCVFSILFDAANLEHLVMEHVDPIASCSRHQFRCEAFEEIEKTVAPLYKIEDDRIVEGRDVLSGLRTGTNLAALDWEDFEHLVRQLFQRLFSERGAQVDVTRASKDRGVDAIVYDPTPVTGMGKIIVQAKRYVNLVDVSAVRDLYGTVINEGATKGILVTTSRFGADAHSFAKGKPLEFIDGQELLRLMRSVQMDNFRIDLEEARRMLGLKPRD